MRFSTIVLVFAATATAAACSNEVKEPVAMPATARASTLAVTVVDKIENAPATHIAVGGKIRLRVPGGEVTSSNAYGPFLIAPAGFETFTVKATGEGTGEIEIETTTGYARVALSAAPIANVGIVFDERSERNATVALLDANGRRLVDASLRVAPGSAPVSFMRDAWDRIVFESLPPGVVFVKTDLLGATKAVVQKAFVKKAAVEKPMVEPGVDHAAKQTTSKVRATKAAPAKRATERSVAQR
ncbi:MAG: hypothetical protein M4D80_21275 [Myxococcota bacterium]|nr:hypothetical protein [Myxococcota bacterium]